MTASDRLSDIRVTDGVVNAEERREWRAEQITDEEIGRRRQSDEEERDDAGDKEQRNKRRQGEQTGR